MAPEAARFYENGTPLVQRYLPFWLANPIERMWVVIASMIVILIPLSRIVPPLYQFRIRSRVFQLVRSASNRRERDRPRSPAQRTAEGIWTDIDTRVERVARAVELCGRTVCAARTHRHGARQG